MDANINMHSNVLWVADIPELRLSNFKINDTDKIDMNKYLAKLRNFAGQFNDEKITDMLNRIYIHMRCDDVPGFEDAYFKYYDDIFNNTFLCDVSKAFDVGEFYLTFDVKDKLKELYKHEFAPSKLYHKKPTVKDLERNGWFTFSYGRLDLEDGTYLNGVWIIDCLI